MDSLSRACSEPRWLAVGDALVISAVLLAGEIQHYGLGVVGRPLDMANVFVSFLVGWFVVAALLGVYERAPSGDPRHSLRLVVGAWLGAANVGIAIRALAFGDLPTGLFPVVITGIALVGLVPWRAAAAWLSEERPAASSPASGEYDAQD